MSGFQVFQGETTKYISAATPFKIHIPPVEYFGKVKDRGSVHFHLCDFQIRFITEGVNIHLEVPNEPVYLKFTLLLYCLLGKSSTCKCGI